MNLENILRNCIQEIKSKWTLPKEGLLAGGSLANLAWEKISGKKAIINDIDIFLFKPNSDLKYYTIFQTQKNLVETYQGLQVSLSQRTKYSVIKSTQEDIFNIIEYYCDDNNPQTIIDSFDLNCCQVAYKIEEDKFYWTEGFTKFITDGKLEVVNLNTPCHSAIRLAKKSDELGVELPKDELVLLHDSLVRHLPSRRLRFKKKFADLYKKYESNLQDFFELTIDGYVDSNGMYHWLEIGDKSLTPLYRLNPKSWTLTEKTLQVYTEEDFITYHREIKNTPKLSLAWENLSVIWSPNFKFKEYLDIELSPKEIKFINRLVTYAPRVSKNLMGLKLSEQWKLIKKVFDKFEEKPLVGISLLEKVKITDEVDLDDEMTLLLLEISLRTENIDEEKSKVENIFIDSDQNCPERPKNSNLPF